MTTSIGKLSGLYPKHGSHANPDLGLCAMEAVAWLAGYSHTDHPICTCPVLAAYVRMLNDDMPDDERQRLSPCRASSARRIREPRRAQYLAWQALTVGVLQRLTMRICTIMPRYCGRCRP